MPKNKAKKNKGRGFRNGGLNDLVKGDSAPPSQEEDTLSESSSVAAGFHDLGSEDAASDGINESAPIEVVEEKLKEAIEGLTEKNAKYRKDCLGEIKKFLRSCLVLDFLDNFQETLIDGIEKCLRKGKGDEQALAAEILAVLAIQLGTTREDDILYSQFKTFLTTIISDVSSPVIARSKCSQVLGILAFVTVDDIEEILSCMSTLDAVFRGSFLKGDKSVPVVNPAVSDLHLNALSSWALLLSVTPWSKVKDFAESRLPRLPELLSSSNVDLRITAGETIALFYEILRSENAGHMMRRLLNEKELISDLKELATDSNKFRAKKDRRQQRSSFRDIVRTVENGDAPEHQIKFGAESFYIDSWTIMRQYSSMKDVLGTGINLHLKENTFLRNVFELGPPLLDASSSGTSKASHFERHLFNQAVFKARSQVRGKLRDKRTGFGT